MFRLTVDPLLVFCKVGSRVVAEDGLLGRARARELLLLAAAASGALLVTYVIRVSNANCAI